MQERLNGHRTEPAAKLRLVGVVPGHLGDPVDQGEPRLRIRMGDRIEDDAVLVRAQPHERRARADRFRPGHAAPHDAAAPVDRRLVWMHLRAHGRVDAVGADEQCGRKIRTVAIRRGHLNGHPSVRQPPVARHARAKPHGIGANPLHDLAVQQHLQLAAVHGVLRPLVPGEPPAPLRVDVVAVQADQRPLFRGHADLVELRFRDAEVIELAYCVGLQVDADAERFHLAHGLEHRARHADLMKGQGRGQPANPATGNEHLRFSHERGHRECFAKNAKISV